MSDLQLIIRLIKFSKKNPNAEPKQVKDFLKLLAEQREVRDCILNYFKHIMEKIRDRYLIPRLPKQMYYEVLNYLYKNKENIDVLSDEKTNRIIVYDEKQYKSYEEMMDEYREAHKELKLKITDDMTVVIPISEEMLDFEEAELIEIVKHLFVRDLVYSIADIILNMKEKNLAKSKVTVVFKVPWDTEKD